MARAFAASPPASSGRTPSAAVVRPAPSSWPGLAGRPIPLPGGEGGLLPTGPVSFYIERHGRQGQAAGQQAEGAFERRGAPRPDLEKPSGRLDPDGGRDPDIAAPVREAAEAAIGPALPAHAVERLLEDAGKGGAQGFLDKRGEASPGVFPQRLDALRRHGREKAFGFEPGREIDEAALQAVLRGEVEERRGPAEAVDLHVHPRSVEHGQAEPGEHDHQQKDDHGDRAPRTGVRMGTCPHPERVTSRYPRPGPRS